MPTKTHMVFITSDEDLVNQISSANSDSTRIIDLDNDDEVVTLGNLQHLSFLAQLTGLNPQNDQTYKDSLTGVDANLSKASSVAKKPADLVCAVCGDRAIGYNYDVLSCGSCKAFFFRHAQPQSKRLRCLLGDGQCLTDRSVRRKCQRCRLDRCFQMGMRKDFLLSAQGKQQKKKRIPINRNFTKQYAQLTTASSTFDPESTDEQLDDIDQLMMDLEPRNGDDLPMEFFEMTDNSPNMLSIDDLLSIESIRSKFVSTFAKDAEQFSSQTTPDQNSPVKFLLQAGNNLGLFVINFFRQIDHFEDLHVDDRFLLIKYNLPHLFPLLTSLHKPNNQPFPFPIDEPLQHHGQPPTLCDGANKIGDQHTQLVLSLAQSTECDPIITSLLVIVSLFSGGLPMTDGHQPILKDSLAVHRAQSYYVHLLWNYLLDKHGESKTQRKFTQFARELIQIQSVTAQIRALLRAQFLSLNDHDSLAPLMQTVLHIS